MTEYKLLKYLREPIIPPPGQRVLTPVVLTDSKGYWVSKHCTIPTENTIKWWFKSGRTSAQGLEWLRSNLDSKIGQLDNISLYIWLGTCDLTTYDGKYIALRSEEQDTIKTLTDNYQHIIELFRNYPGCKLTFLQLPPYSIYAWNKYKQHPELKQFIEQDIKLLKQYTEINEHISKLNRTLGLISPNFASDIYHKVNKKKSDNKRKASDQYNFNLYRDGIHPDTTLARVWLRKITKLVIFDCW
ncbi:unnamed protein product [Mytilus edulis]|uniref:Uncharacterized protein n=1 Tax=Mytilus edulis TaxID=6550 RepID=A0A8S3TQ37_MYTED|nr:unnamed protein product [Mytilus edulis]